MGVRLEKDSSTTGSEAFAECQKHLAKALLHSAKGLPSVTLGKAHSVNPVTAKETLLSAFFGRGVTVTAILRSAKRKDTRPKFKVRRVLPCGTR